MSDDRNAATESEDAELAEFGGMILALMADAAEEMRQAATELDRLRSRIMKLERGIAEASNELAVEHYGGEGCRICWPADGGQHCVARMVAGDLRALIDGGGS